MRLEVAIRVHAGAFTLDVALDVSGPTCVLLGPSGAGKTMLVRSIAGIVHPAAGRIVVDKTTLFDSSQDVDMPVADRRIGWVPQSYALFPHLTVEENVAFGLAGAPASERRAAVARLLKLLKLTGLERRRPGSLSGGQQQRVAVARALAVKPRLLLLDEPFAALDPALRDELREELAETARELAVGMVLVSHDVVDAWRLADTVVVMEHGRALQAGPRDEVFHRPTSVAVARWTGSRNVLPGTVISRAGERARVAAAGLELEAALDGAPGAAIALVLRPERLRLLADGEAAAPDETVAPVRVQRASVRGSHCTVDVLADGDAGAAIAVDAPIWWWERHAAPPGARLRLAVPRAAVHVLAGTS